MPTETLVGDPGVIVSTGPGAVARINSGFHDAGLIGATGASWQGAIVLQPDSLLMKLSSVFFSMECREGAIRLHGHHAFSIIDERPGLSRWPIHPVYSAVYPGSARRFNRKWP
jgi:hypothetical protein